MSSRTLSVVLTAIMAVILGASFLFGGSGDPAADAGGDGFHPPRLGIDAPDWALRGDPLIVPATVEHAEATDVEWLVDGHLAGRGAELEFVPEAVRTIEIYAQVSDRTGRVATAVALVEIRANPLDDDDDGDGLDNRAELAAGTSPSNPDTDDDGVSDAVEVAGPTDPLVADTDDDDLPDGFELAFALDPVVADADIDTDADGFANVEEYEAGTNPRNARFYPGAPFEPTTLLAAEGVTLGATGIEATFADAAITRTSSTVEAGSGIFYIEATRAAGAEASLGFVEAGVEPVTSDQLRLSVALPEASTVGLIVDARTSDLGVWTIQDADGVPELGDRVSLGSFSSVAATVAGEVGAMVTLNAGDDPVGHPLAFGPHYLLFNSGVSAAEFMGLGFGTVNEYTGREQPIEYPSVRLTIDEHTGTGIQVASDGRTVAYGDATGKYVVLANQGMVGEFRYWEATRLTPEPENLGQGILTRYSLLDPYPGSLDDRTAPSQPGMSLNSLQGIWQYPISIGSYDQSNTVYGFAVDYRGSRPVVYVIVGDELVATVTLDDVFTPVHPAMYGTVADGQWKHRANFGTDPFIYDASSVLRAAGVDTSDLVLGWGVHVGEVAGDAAAEGAQGGATVSEQADDDA